MKCIETDKYTNETKRSSIAKGTIKFEQGQASYWYVRLK